MSDFNLTDEECEQMNNCLEGDDDDITINNKNIKKVN